MPATSSPASVRGSTSATGTPRGSSAAVLDLLAAAQRGLTEAVLESRSSRRYAVAHLAALRAAAAVLATRARPTGRRGPRSAWDLLAQAAPELAEWAAFFAAGAGKRSAAEAGLDAVTSREADDLLRDVETFLALAETTVGVPHQTTLPRVS
ncbi:MAG: SAV_6107 family HEPN domain-containing protein [Actinomycetes bacterium]|jgi:sugar phosphate isomerase/epimerase